MSDLSDNELRRQAVLNRFAQRDEYGDIECCTTASGKIIYSSEQAACATAKALLDIDRSKISSYGLYRCLGHYHLTSKGFSFRRVV